MLISAAEGGQAPQAYLAHSQLLGRTSGVLKGLLAKCQPQLAEALLSGQPCAVPLHTVSSEQLFMLLQVHALLPLRSLGASRTAAEAARGWGAGGVQPQREKPGEGLERGRPAGAGPPVQQAGRGA